MSYRVRVEVERRSGSETSDDIVVLRTASGLASVRPASATLTNQIVPDSAPPALPIALDALAEWAFRLDDSGAVPRLAVAYERPHGFPSATPAPGVDVAVTSVRGFDVAYVAGEPSHLRLTPATPAMRAYAAIPDDFVYRDVIFDPVTMLPTRVVLTAPNETLTLDYAMPQGVWLLSRAVDDDESRARDPKALRRLEAVYDAVTAEPAGDARP